MTTTAKPNGVGPEAKDEAPVDGNPQNAGAKGVAASPESHVLCEEPKGGFQCGDQYLWWLNYHDHTDIAGGPNAPKAEETPVPPVKDDDKGTPKTTDNQDSANTKAPADADPHADVDAGESRPKPQPDGEKDEPSSVPEGDESVIKYNMNDFDWEKYDANDPHALCDRPENGFPCGNSLQWWLFTHQHITVNTPVEGTTEYIDYKYEDTLKAYDDPKNADTNGDGLIDNREAGEYAQR